MCYCDLLVCGGFIVVLIVSLRWVLSFVGKCFMDCLLCLFRIVFWCFYCLVEFYCTFVDLVNNMLLLLDLWMLLLGFITYDC